MKKAQVSIVYLGIITLISMFIFGIVFVWSSNIRDETSIEFNAQHSRNLLTYFEQRLVSLRTLAEPPNGSANNVSVIVEVPVNIGDEKYFVRGEGNDLVLEIPGKGFAQGRQTIFRKNIYWWNTSFEGGAFSSNGEIIFSYNSNTGDVTLS